MNRDALPARGPLATSVAAGAAYFGLVFAVGFVLGTVRTLWVADAPGAGRLAAVLVELPIMLAASWFLCGAVVRRFGVPATRGARLVMGGLAFGLLIGAETLLGTLLFGRSVAAQFALYREASYALGLAAQVVFGAMPLWRLRRDAGRGPIRSR
jgi:hypothetical protein